MNAANVGASVPTSRRGGSRTAKRTKTKKNKPQKTEADAGLRQPKKLGYMEKRELEALPRRIEKLEAEQKNLYEQMADPELYKQKGEGINRIRERSGELEKILELAYERWEALEAINTSD